MRKSDNCSYRDSWKSKSFRESNREKKQRIDTINEAKKIKINNSTNVAMEKIPKLLSQY